MHDGPTVGEYVSKAGTIKVIDCLVCGYRHIMPLPSSEDLEVLYKEAFYQTDIPQYLALSEEDRAWKRLEMADRFQVVEAKLAEKGALAGQPSKSAKRVLDIGSGPGDFLAVGQSRGWHEVGVEPSRVAADFAKDQGLRVYEGMFDRAMADKIRLDQQLGTPGAKGFDFIHLSEVLEHILEPQTLLKAAFDLLRPGGVVCISCPNDFNPLQKAAVSTLGGNDWWIHPHHHINYFTFDSLEKLMTKTGLVPFARSTNFPMEFHLLFGDDYRSDPKLGRQLHQKRKNFDLSLDAHQPETRRALYHQLAAVGLGRLAIVYGQKPVD